MNRTFAKALGLACLAAVLLAGPAMAWAQPADSAQLAQQWDDFIHYIRIARPDAARANAQAILESQPDPAAVYRQAAATGDLLDVLARGEGLRDRALTEAIAQIRQLIEQGYRQVRQDPQNIARALELLGGNVRQYMMGKQQLEASGEMAVPQVVQTLSDPDLDPMVRDRLVSVLPGLGRLAVRPLSVALGEADAEVREVIARALGQIGYAHAAPYLKARLEDPAELESVKQAAGASLAAIAGREALGRPQASLWYNLAEKYYTDDESVGPDPRLDTANVWYWEEGLGLNYVEVPLAIFGDVYTMRTARKALEADADFAPAVSLWLAANLRKEAHLPEGVQDPTRGPTEVDAQAYAKAAGAMYAQQVLARALRDGDTAVAVGIIEPLAGVLGRQNIARPVEGGVNPLVEALGYPNRRVRFLAAESLANARPLQNFPGSDLVMTVLVEALRQTGQPTALVIEPDQTRRNTLKDLLRQAGYATVEGGDYGQAVQAARQASGVDVVVMSGAIRGPGPAEAMQLLRADAMLAPLPVILVAGEEELYTARGVAREDALALIQERTLLDADTFGAALDQAQQVLIGTPGMEQAEADRWALTAASSIRMLGLSRTPVYDITRAENALAGALADPRDVQKVAAANALAVVPTGSAQQAIVDLAASTEVPEEVRIAAYEAAAESVRLLGNQLTDGQIQAIIALVKDEQASQPLRDAASLLLGALDLPSEQIRTLITTSFQVD